LAQDVSRAVRAERDTHAVQSQAADARIRVRRTRAMLDQLLARRARALGELNPLRGTDGGTTWTIVTSSYGVDAGIDSKPDTTQPDGGRR
jgi:hypothetical protein